ncbi:MAG TPA: hypothetical protein VN721_14480 [Flavipsychrobacter sp.]|nr:hypothetical protein [Flavipsychrobacter sp.]
MKTNDILLMVLLLIVATALEATGDALVRRSIYEYTGLYRIICVVVGAVLLLGYGFMVNLAPIEFGKVVGLYISTLFIMWQVINYIIFRTVPSASVITGGAMIIIGGLIVTFGKF